LNLKKRSNIFFSHNLTVNKDKAVGSVIMVGDRNCSSYRLIVIYGRCFAGLKNEKEIEREKQIKKTREAYS